MKVSPKFRLFDASEAPLNGVTREEVVTVTGAEFRRECGIGGHTSGDTAAGEDGERMFRQVLDLGAPTEVRTIEAQTGGPGDVLSVSQDGRHYRTIARFPARGYKRLSATYRYWRLSYPLMPEFNRPSGPFAAAGAPHPVKSRSGFQATKISRRD